jgi:hypothetical protein
MPKLEVIHQPSAKCKVNVVFVHGLGGDAWYTWAHNGKQENFWPPRVADAVLGAGVYSLGYDATPSTWMGNAALSIPDRATSVL